MFKDHYTTNISADIHIAIHIAISWWVNFVTVLSYVLQQPLTAGLAKIKADITKKGSHPYSSCCLKNPDIDNNNNISILSAMHPEWKFLHAHKTWWNFMSEIELATRVRIAKTLFASKFQWKVFVFCLYFKLLDRQDLIKMCGFKKVWPNCGPVRPVVPPESDSWNWAVKPKEL